MSLPAHSVKSDSANTLLESNFEQLKKDYPSIQEIRAENKDLLYRQGEQCAYVYWIKSGIVKLSHLTTQGTEIAIALINKGDVIGCLQEDISSQIMEDTAHVLGEVSFYRLAYHDFKSLLMQHASLTWQVLEQTYARKKKIERKLRTFLTQSVEMRLAEILLELAEMFGIRCMHGYALEIHLTQQEVADLIGASRSVVSTILNDFRNRGMLDYTRDQICINDVALIDFCHLK